MNGETCHQKIISFLYEKERSFTKEVIAQNVHHTVGTVAKALSELANGEHHPKYVVEFNGKWSITKAGKELPSNFDRTYFERPKQTQSKAADRVFWLELIDWEFARNDFYCRQVLEDPQGFKENWKPVNKYLTIFVLLFLLGKDVEIKQEEHKELEKVDDMRPVFEALTDYLNKKI